jgi:hypothetical protein
VQLAIAHPSRAPRRAVVAALGVACCALVAACSNDEAGGTMVADAEGAATRPEPAVISTPASPYRAIEVRDGGRIGGTIRVAGEMPRDTTVHPTRDVRVCGASLVDRTLTHDRDRLGGALVWLEDIRAGSPLPMRRRYEVTNTDCRLEPRVQGVLAGGTLNVKSADAVIHRTRVLRRRDGRMLARYEQNDAGEVVPDDDVLATPGLLELRSEVHPWTRGFVAVFDHPYFVVTAANGQFSFVDVPAGTYTLAAWHERFGKIEQRVTVTADSATTVTLTFGEPGAVAEGDAAAVAASDTARPNATARATQPGSRAARAAGQGR